MVLYGMVWHGMAWHDMVTFRAPYALSPTPRTLCPLPSAMVWYGMPARNLRSVSYTPPTPSVGYACMHASLYVEALAYDATHLPSRPHTRTLVRFIESLIENHPLL